jgi:uncharacterized protein (TIGR03435 family)
MIRGQIPLQAHFGYNTSFLSRWSAMKINRVAFALFLVSGASILLAQKSVPTKEQAAELLIVDVHCSPYRPKIVYRTNITNQRFDMRNATIFDMIEFAYGLGEQDDDRENAAIVGGPSWIDFDRFDVSAKIPSLKAPAFQAGPMDPANPPEDPNDRMRSVFKRVLAERFHLKYHTETRSLPGYVVTVAKQGAKLTEAKNPTAPNQCHGERDKANPEQYKLTCASETVGQFVSTLDQAFPHPIMDRTGLTKPYDFSLKLVLGPEVHTRDDLARIYTDAFSKQLGLAVVHGDVPQDAYVVDAVDRTPTTNSPNVAKLLPALPDLEFEVASIRLAADNEPQLQVRPTGSQITFSSFSLQDLITRAWQLPTGAMLGNALPLLPRTRYTILVKLPPDIDGRAVNQDQDQIANMLQKLVIDRFQVKYHWGEWTQPDAYVLLRGTPKMKKADPNSRSFCKYGPADGEKPARYANSPFDSEFHCENVTMAQFADRLQAMAGSDVKNRVADKTGLAGSYDFTVFYTTSRTLRAQSTTAAAEAKQAGDATSAPVAGLGLEDAFRKQLGLRLEKQPLIQPSLLLDHFEQSPTAN